MKQNSFLSSLVLLGSVPLFACGDDEGDGGTGGVAGTTQASSGSGATKTTAASVGATSTGTTTATTTSASSTASSSATGSALCPPTATTVDLAQVIARADAMTEAAFGSGLDDREIYFQDGLNAVGFPAPNDMGAIVVSYDGPADRKIFPDQRFVYRASVWGIEDLMIARVVPFNQPGWNANYPPGDDMFTYYAPGSATGLLVDGVTPAEENALRTDFEASFPGATMSFFGGGIFTFVGVVPSSLGAAFDFMTMRAEVSLIEGDGEVYATDFGFGPRVSLDDEITTGPIDVYEDHAFLSAWLRGQGQRTFNLPTLPRPFGPGALARSSTANYVIQLADMADPDACTAGLEACGFDTLDQGGQRFLVDPSYLAASGLRHACVASLSPQ